MQRIFLAGLLIFFNSKLISGIAIKDLLFKKGEVINFCFINGDEESRKQIQDVGKIWLKYANIQFNFLQLPCKEVPENFRVNLVRITFDFEKGYQSYTGNYINTIPFPESTMWIKTSILDTGYSNQEKTRIFHEFGHVLGLEHEHFHPFIQKQINDKIIKSCQETRNWTESQFKFNLIPVWTFDEMIIDEFDKDSVMMYNLRDYGENFAEYKRKFFISPKDIQFIRKLYPK